MTAFAILVASVFVYETVMFCTLPGAMTVVGAEEPLIDKVVARKGALIAIVAFWVMYETTSVGSVDDFAVPTIK